MNSVWAREALRVSVIDRSAGLSPAWVAITSTSYTAYTASRDWHDPAPGAAGYVDTHDPNDVAGALRRFCNA